MPALDQIHDAVKGDKLTRYRRLVKEYLRRVETETGIVPELLTAGVPKEDIVLDFQAPKERKYTEFAVA